MNGICIVAHLAYGAMTGGRTGHFGGVERQTSLMARWLAGRGHRVSLLTWDEGQPDEVTIEGVRVIKMWRRGDGLSPRWRAIPTVTRGCPRCARFASGSSIVRAACGQTE